MAFSGFQDLDPQFAAALQRFIADSPGISPYSGYRSPERQAVLYRNAVAKYGSEQAARKWVAPPGRSRHGMRTAVDLRYDTPAARQWAHANATKYGLTYPMSWEPWHIEPVGARNGGAGNQASAPPEVAAVASSSAATENGAPVQAALAGAPFSQQLAGTANQAFTPQALLERRMGLPDPQAPLSMQTAMSDIMMGVSPMRRVVMRGLMGLFG